MSERDRWEALAARHPYWTVLVDEQYRSGRMDARGRDAFFESGQREVAATLETIRSHMAPGFLPARALDYGCGVGRLTIPIARESSRVLGVDVSDRMLEESRRNCAEHGVHNVELMNAESFLGASDSGFAFDFVHSYIVFQHIPPATGMQITECLLRRLTPGGVGALHFTYARRTSLLQRLVNPLRRLPPVNAAVNALRGRPLDEPMLPVFDYDLRALFHLLRDHGCDPVLVKLVEHGKFSGAMLMFRKQVPVTGVHA